MRTRNIMLAVAGAALLATATARAHHAFAAEFDSTKPVTLEGTVTMMEWVNPHSWLHIEVTEADGTVTAWAIEAGSPNTLLRRGMTRDSIKPGMAVVVDGFRAKDGTNKANGRDVKLADGSQLFLGSSGVGAPPR